VITQKTAAAIWAAYREIEAAEKLLSDIAKEKAEPFSDRDKFAPQLKDVFGNRRNLQLGIPSGENGNRLFDVRPDLAESVIRAHIAHKRVDLTEANESARLELKADEVIA